jgi:hypothetical protein
MWNRDYESEFGDQWRPVVTQTGAKLCYVHGHDLCDYRASENGPIYNLDNNLGKFDSHKGNFNILCSHPTQSLLKFSSNLMKPVSIAEVSGGSQSNLMKPDSIAEVSGGSQWNKNKILGIGALIFAGVCVTTGVVLSVLSLGALSPAGFLLGSLGFKLGLTGLALLAVDAAVCLAGAALILSILLPAKAIYDCKNGGIKEEPFPEGGHPISGTTPDERRDPNNVDPHSTSYGGGLDFRKSVTNRPPAPIDQGIVPPQLG